MKFGPVVQEEMSFKGKKFTDGRTMDKDWSQYLTLSLPLRWAKKKKNVVKTLDLDPPDEIFWIRPWCTCFHFLDD